MAITFYLYRLKIERQPESLFSDLEKKTPPQIVREAILEKPSKELRKDQDWHIGNIEEIGENGLFFAIGRVTKSIVEKYDEIDGNFRDEPDEQAPYTYVVIDLKYQVCGIAHKAKISQKVSGIANKLKSLLDITQVAADTNVEFNISSIKDPEEFIKQIREAFSIKNFEIEFRPPNPSDDEEDLQKPLEKALESTNGKKAKVSIEGDGLKSETIEKYVAIAVSSGTNASAKLQLEEGARPVIKRIANNPITYTTDENTIKNEKNSLLESIFNLYKKVKDRGGLE